MKNSKPRKSEIENPANPSHAHSIMTPRWAKINALLGGTEAMREAGPIYLPQHHREYDEDYEERLECSVLLNVFEITVDTLAGKPFTQPLVLQDDVPEIIRNEYVEDIDLQGNHIDQFAGRVFRDGIAKGLTHIMVDTPALMDGEERTLAQERDQGIRPYLIHLPPENVLGADSVTIKGHEVLTHFRSYEAELERVGFAEQLAEFIRVFDLEVVEESEGDEMPKFAVRLRRFRKEDKKKNGKDQWTLIEDRITQHESIPVHTFYAQRTDFMLSKPPLLDLADMNILHWQSYSDQINILKVARFPLLAASGIEDTSETTLGPRNVLTTDDSSARYYYVEHSGTAIEAGRKSLEELVDQMGLYGATLLRQRPDRETATSRSIEERNQSAPLQKMALAFKDILENAFRTMASMIGLDSGGSITIHTDFGFDGGEVVDLQTLQVLYRDFAISREAVLGELKRRGILSEDFDIQADEDQLRKEIEARIGAILAKNSPPQEEGDTGDGNDPRSQTDEGNEPEDPETPTEDRTPEGE